MIWRCEKPLESQLRSLHRHAFDPRRRPLGYLTPNPNPSPNPNPNPILRRRPLGYLSVKPKTQRQLFLYCPEGLGHGLGEEEALS
eukprot:scaffold97609_cov42-Phaeocystis_antarctica.AAC.1